MRIDGHDIMVRRFHEEHAEMTEERYAVYRELLEEQAEAGWSLPEVVLAGLVGMGMMVLYVACVEWIAHSTGGDFGRLLEGPASFLTYPLFFLILWVAYRLRRSVWRGLARSEAVLRAYARWLEWTGQPLLQPERTVEEQLRRPVRVELELDGEPPRVTWRLDGGPEVAERRVIVEHGLGEARDAEEESEERSWSTPEEGRLVLGDGEGSWFHLSRGRDDERLYLSCRTEEGAIAFECPRPSWMDDASWERLPILEQRGILLDEEEGEFLLREIERFSLAVGRAVQGLRVPAEVRRAR